MTQDEMDLINALSEYRSAQDKVEETREGLAKAVQQAYANGMTQVEIANFLMVSRVTVRKWLS